MLTIWRNLNVDTIPVMFQFLALLELLKMEQLKTIAYH